MPTISQWSSSRQAMMTMTMITCLAFIPYLPWCIRKRGRCKQLAALYGFFVL
jgi:hypothetical protein